MLISRILSSFERWIDPFAKKSDFRPPAAALRFIWFYVSQAKGAFLAMLVIGGLVAMLSSVLDARGKEYMMMNAPAVALDRIRDLIPGLSGPTVMPLADPAMIAVHSVVERSQLWRLVPALREAGARDILVVPIEKVIR